MPDYTPTTWVDDDGTGTVGTALTATRLNNIEAGVDAAHRPIVDTLPVSPVDGDICFYQNAGMAAEGILWMLRYRAGAPTYKWEFIGGSPWLNEAAAGGATSSTTYATVGAVGPSITIPRLGDYTIAIGTRAYNSVSGATTTMSYSIGATAASDTDAVAVALAISNTDVTVAARTRVKTFATGDALVGKYKTSSGSASFTNRWMQVTPVRIG